MRGSTLAANSLDLLLLFAAYAKKWLGARLIKKQRRQRITTEHIKRIIWFEYGAKEYLRRQENHRLENKLVLLNSIF